MFRPSTVSSVRNVGKVRLYKRLNVEVRNTQHEIETRFDVRLRGEISEDHVLSGSNLSILDVSEHPSVSFFIREKGKLVKRETAVKWYNEQKEQQSKNVATMSSLRRDLLASCPTREVERALKG